MKKADLIFGVLRIPFDVLAVFASLFLSYKLRISRIDLIPRVQLLEPAQTLPLLPDYLSSFVLPGVCLFIVVAAFLGLYALRSTGSAWMEAGKIVVAALLWLVAVMAWYFLLRKQLFYSRVLLIHSTFFIVLFVGVARALLILLQRTFLRFGFGVCAVVSIGGQPLAATALRILSEDPRYTYGGHLHGLSDLGAFLRKGSVDLVLQTDPNPGSGETLALIERCRSEHLGYAFLPPVLADVPHQLRIERLGLLPLICFRPTPLDGWGRIWKRGFDLLLSTLLTILLFPLFLLLALLIVFDGGWPVLYVSRRIGEYGRTSIPVLKFRTMVRNAERKKRELQHLSHRRGGPLFKVKGDPRVTPSGQFLRRWSLDELPQLLNVLCGQMSLVGPRPHLPEEVQKYTSYQRRVFAVKPGMTGLAQVMGRSDLSFEEEVHYDLQYVEEWSPLLDLWILWRTIFVILSHRAAD